MLKTGFGVRDVKLLSFNDKRFIVMRVFTMQLLAYLFLLGHSLQGTKDYKQWMGQNILK